MAKGIRILSTKKLLPNQRQYLLNAGFGVIDADFVSVAYTTPALTAVKQNLIFTSQNAFKSFLQHPESGKLKKHPVFCVGKKTKEIIENSGFVVTACTDYGQELAETITDNHTGKSFTFFSGSLRRDVLPDALTANGFDFNEVLAYETTLTPQIISTPLDALLFFSPSGVESYLLQNSLSSQPCFCIGTTTAQAMEGKATEIIVANKPSVENVIVQCINYYKNK